MVIHSGIARGRQVGSVGTVLGEFRSLGVGSVDSQRDGAEELAGAEDIAGAVAIASVGVNIRMSIIYYNCYA